MTGNWNSDERFMASSTAAVLQKVRDVDDGKEDV
jgi:hypothetical protein